MIYYLLNFLQKTLLFLVIINQVHGEEESSGILTGTEEVVAPALTEGGIILEYYDSGKYQGLLKQELQLLEDGQSIAIRRYFYEGENTTVYDIFDNKTIYKKDQEGVTTTKYDADNRITSLERFVFTDGEAIKYVEDGKGNKIICERSIYNEKGKCFEKKMYSTADGLLEKIEEEAMPADEMFTYLNTLLKENNLPNVQEMSSTYFGPFHLMLAGYYDHPLEAGVIGFGEVSDKVRMTYTNGILNRNSDCVYAAQIISKMHGGVNVHFILRPTRGWSSDMMQSVSVWFGSLTPQARLLADVWKKLIKEMGGPAGGGLIYHYAHSIGASETWNARTLLSQEEKAMIRVVTVGSPFMIHKDGLHSVVNYVSVRDGVPLISLLDPFGYFNEEGYNIVLVGNLLEGMPFIDHPIYSPNYLAIFYILGKQFVETYGKVQENALP